jgi:hypothetical protein
MTEPPVISNAISRQTIFLVWAIVATVWGLISTGLAVFFFFQSRGTRDESAGWARWETSAGGNGHWYKAVALTDGITWPEADHLARAQGGYLATITSAAENDFVFNLVNAPEFFGNGKGPALGGFQQDQAPEPDGGWCWVSGEPWNYSHWHSTEPSNGRVPSGTEDRLQFYSGIPRTPGATWNDVNKNDLDVGGYVIERNH